MNTWLLNLAWRSAWNRRFTLALTVLSIALATIMLLGMERLRHELRGQFTAAVSGTDLIVGTRGGQLPLLLYTLFHTGSPTGTLKMSSVLDIARQPGVAWAVPIAKGDSHQGYPVIGTTQDYFQHVRYGLRQVLEFASGSPWQSVFDVVLGADVARDLGYAAGTTLTLAHGDGQLNVIKHDDKPFRVSGVLVRTGTPVDRTLLISLQAMDALHTGWLAGTPMPGRLNGPGTVTETPRPGNTTNPPDSLDPASTGNATTRPEQRLPANATVNAALIGLERRAAVFSLQRFINGYKNEPLMAILPGVALDELWGLITPVEKTLRIMAWLVAGVSLAGLVSVLLASMNERRRELAILRSIGVRPSGILAVVSLESLCVALAGMLLGSGTLAAGIAFGGSWLQARTGLHLTLSPPTLAEGTLLAALLGVSLLASLLPAWRAYRATLADGLSPTV
ncbi:MAG: ABC transporter permease [Alcaligenaceae bacterium]|nr:ABC transporter permease [Alcaligenaceae bacterium]